ncbi:hypothetical protein FBULB1_8290 [Fusarium bulbicola]|nr:hypothetical protein FBULB1_8290 [Fusarium bulbicola]
MEVIQPFVLAPWEERVRAAFGGQEWNEEDKICLPPWTFAAPEIHLVTFVQEVFEHMLLGRRAAMVEHCERTGHFRRDVRLALHEWMTTDPVLGGLPFTMKGLKSKQHDQDTSDNSEISNLHVYNHLGPSPLAR